MMQERFLNDVSEQQRLATLDSYDILDSAPEAGFDDIVMLARAVCDTPIALVSFVAANRQWFKAASGLDACETPLSQSVCFHALKQTETLIIPDLTKDERTKANTLVTDDPFIRFYAGALLKSRSGIPIGTLCVIDIKPRPAGLTPSQITSLEALARQVMAQLELRQALATGETAFADQQMESATYENRAIESERLAELLRINEARLRMAQEAGKIGSFEIDISKNRITATEQFCRIFGVPPQPMFAPEIFEQLVHPDDRHLVSSTGKRRDGDLDLYAEYRIVRGSTGETAWVARRAQIVRDASGKPVRMMGTVHDITERKQIDERQRFLSQELSHRMKNTLSLVQAIASQTLGKATDRDAVHAFGQRINALSKAHDVLLQQTWTAADMRDVMKSVLGLHGDPDRFVMTGGAVKLGPKAVLSLSLLVHELATNAIKYGALSAAGGRVDIAWSPVGENVVLKWNESGGPVVVPPERKGLGARLIDMGLAGTGNVTQRYDPSGFQVEFQAPLKLLEEN